MALDCPTSGVLVSLRSTPPFLFQPFEAFAKDDSVMMSRYEPEGSGFPERCFGRLKLLGTLRQRIQLQAPSMLQPGSLDYPVSILTRPEGVNCTMGLEVESLFRTQPRSRCCC